MSTNLTLSDGTKIFALSCPFCGSNDLSVVAWCGDQGEFDAIECNKCLGSAPWAGGWNSRVEALGVCHEEKFDPPACDPLDEALNSGDGVYRP